MDFRTSWHGCKQSQIEFLNWQADSLPNFWIDEFRNCRKSDLLKCHISGSTAIRIQLFNLRSGSRISAALQESTNMREVKKKEKEKNRKAQGRKEVKVEQEVEVEKEFQAEEERQKILNEKSPEKH